MRALARADDLQERLNTGHALNAAASALTPLVGRGEGLSKKVEFLIRGSDLGLTYLSVQDAQGRILAADGLYERLAVPFLTTLARQQLRSFLYRLGAEHGSVPLMIDGQAVGRLEYSVDPDVAVDVRESAIGELQFAGWFGLLIALPTIGALAFAIRRPPGPDPAIAARESAYRSQEPQAVEDIEEPQITRTLSQHGMHALDALKRALIVVDRDARIRFMNRCAAEITGWQVEDVKGRLVYSVFHPLDDEQAPLVTPAETCLRENREYEPSELWVRSRDGTVRAVEVMAALLREKAGAQPTGAAMVFHVIDDRRGLIDQLRRESRLSQGIIDHLVEGVITTDPSGVIRFANARALRMFGYGRDELAGVTITKLMPVPFLNTPGLHLTDYVGGRHQTRLPKVVGWRKDATTFPIELVVQPMTVEDSEGLVVITRDITERLRGENLAQRLGRLLDAASEEVYIFDAQSLYFVEVNRGARRNLGYQPNELTRLSMLSISAELEQDTFQSYLARLRGGEIDHVTYRCKHVRADGSQYPVEVRLNFSREEEPPMFMAIAVDITDREAQEDRLRYLAHHDPLTGLPNRATLLDRLRQAILTASRSSRLVGVFFVDLDRFKHINDSFGHEIGDVVLELAAKRLSAVLREADTVARLGGDEFVVVAQGLRGLDDAEGLARKILEVFEDRFEIPEHDLRITPSVGVSLYPLDESDAEGLLRHADASMYQAKQSGPGQYRLYSVEVPPEKKRRLDLERGLHAAFALNQLAYEVRPAVDLATGAVSAILLDFYWEHPRQGRIDQNEVQAAAGRAGVLADLELWLIFSACGLRGHLPEDPDMPPLPIIVPLSGWQLRDAEFSNHVFELMERHGVPPRQLVFALTSEGLLEARDAPHPLVRRLLERGVRFALRGAAGASFNALHAAGNLPLDLLVLQPEEVALVPSDPEATERLRLAMMTANGLNLPVLAAGVSSAEGRDWLHSQGARFAAGPLFGAVVEPEKVGAQLAKRETAPI
ncbi:MAG TPA: PAS domain S-box protein [Nevskiaceae bacterium]|nr:PAS domain S-box protein [Nevskiaceae bacterium]